MKIQDYLIRDSTGRIIGTVHEIDRVSGIVRWVKEHYDYWPLGLSFEKCTAETASQISEQLKQREERARELTEILGLNY